MFEKIPNVGSNLNNLTLSNVIFNVISEKESLSTIQLCQLKHHSVLPVIQLS